MKYRTLGKTSFRVSEVSLGTWQLGGKWGEDFNPKTAQEILEKSLELGINFIDTADVYNNGQSEVAIGKFLKKIDQRVYVATKSGRLLNPHTAEGYNKENITGFVEDSLKRLDVDILDLVQLHCPPTDVYYQDTAFDVLEDLKDQGKIAHYGVSVEKVEEALAAIERPGVASVQIIYNMFRLKPALEFFKKAHKNNVGIIVRVPLASGLLSGRYDKNTKFSSGDHRNFNREGKFFDKGETFSGVPYEVGLEAVEELKEVFEGGDLALYALRWILENEHISCVIPGASRVEQIVSNASASELPALSDEQMNMVNEIYEKYVEEHVQHLW